MRSRTVVQAIMAVHSLRSHDELHMNVTTSDVNYYHNHMDLIRAVYARGLNPRKANRPDKQTLRCMLAAELSTLTGEPRLSVVIALLNAHETAHRDERLAPLLKQVPEIAVALTHGVNVNKSTVGKRINLLSMQLYNHDEKPDTTGDS